MSDLKYQISGTVHQIVEFQLEAGQRLFSETGGMIWMDHAISLDTAMPGGGKGGVLGALGGALSRAVSGESIFLNYFTASGGPGSIAFGSSFPGRVLDFNLGPGQSVIAQRGAFLVGQDSVQLKMEFTRKLGAGLLGGEGFVLQRLSGPGQVFLEIHGELTMKDLAPGQRVRVDTGHVAAFEESVSYDIEFQKGLKNMLLSGEGLALAVLTGPGRVWLQHQTISGLAQSISPYIAKGG